MAVSAAPATGDRLKKKKLSDADDSRTATLTVTWYNSGGTSLSNLLRDGGRTHIWVDAVTVDLNQPIDRGVRPGQDQLGRLRRE